MLKYSIYFLIASVLYIYACNEASETNYTITENSGQKTEPWSSSITGSWVQPNPINEKEVQGFTLNADSSASSINMSTLLYKKWWANNGTLYLVTESIGNKVSSVDTTAYEVVYTDSALEIKNGNYTDKYVKQ